MTGRFVRVAAVATLACTGPSPLRIAVVEGNGSHHAAELAAEDINARGGINGRLLELAVVVEPDDVTPQQAIAIADSLSRDPSILGVVGHGGSATSLAASQVYGARRVPQLAPTTTSPVYTTAGPYSFRMVASDTHQARFIAERIEGRERRANVAILYVNDDYGRGFRSLLVRELRSRGIDAVRDVPFIAGAEFARAADEIVLTMSTADPDIIVWLGLAPELQAIRPALRRALPRTQVLASDGASFVAVGDLAAFEGDQIVALVDVHADRPVLRDVAERFRPLAGRELTDAAALVYDAVGVFAEAMKAGATSRRRLQRFLEATAANGRTFTGIAGTVAFDEYGDARPAYVLLEVRGGAAEVVAR